MTSLPTKLRGPIDARETQKEVLETSSLITISPSATIVPVPTEHRHGFACNTTSPKFDPVCSTGERWYPQAAQVVDDVGAVAEETHK